MSDFANFLADPNSSDMALSSLALLRAQLRQVQQQQEIQKQQRKQQQSQILQERRALLQSRGGLVLPSGEQDFEQRRAVLRQQLAQLQYEQMLQQARTQQARQAKLASLRASALSRGGAPREIRNLAHISQALAQQGAPESNQQLLQHYLGALSGSQRLSPASVAAMAASIARSRSQKAKFAESQFSTEPEVGDIDAAVVWPRPSRHGSVSSVSTQQLPDSTSFKRTSEEMKTETDMERKMDEISKKRRLEVSKNASNHLKLPNMTTGGKVKAGEKRCNQSSRFRGVSWHKRDKAWVARVWNNGKSEHVGVFSSEVRAALAVDLKLIEYRGNPEILNFPDPKEREKLIETFQKMDEEHRQKSKVSQFLRRLREKAFEKAAVDEAVKEMSENDASKSESGEEKESSPPSPPSRRPPYLGTASVAAANLAENSK
mmetsp:Transcript_4183/g.7333  ORF Transcript_4183/g.7333 Transcript_4183/m.7333 type:complete len:432 (+) Transcript_4183:167-1462(+)